MPLTVVALIASAAAIAPAASAQTNAPMRPIDIEVACAPPPAATKSAHALRVIGAQDTAPRTIFDNRDLLLINGGTDAGVQLDARFFVRRTSTFGSAYMTTGLEDSAITDGWIRIVAVNQTTSIARPEHVCGGAIFAGDVLEPYAPPQVPDDLTATPPPMAADFDHLARVVSGPAGRRVAAIGEFAVLDHGAEEGVKAGGRVAFYRDLTDMATTLAAPAGTPLTAIGEAVVVSTSGSRTLVRIVRARDAVETGDYAAPLR